MNSHSVPQELFNKLFSAKNESEVNQVLATHPQIFQASNWYPLAGNESNFGIIENQQSNPVAAIVEKLTNSIDALLMRRCIEERIDPRSADAPRTVDEAILRFFPRYKDWDLSINRNEQAQRIQVIGDGHRGPKEDTSLIIYDDGEGQHPQDFENTFLSLVRGNKNEIHFVQGKYNMGGSGAIVFCGKKRYQLIASKRFDGSGDFGFTLIRKHPLTESEANTKKNTWYEYFKIDGQIPSFPINGLDLGLLHGTQFKTGTIIKLYSYEVKSNKHVRRDLSRSLNEFLYEPALPVYAVETEERYPNDKVLDGVIYGLKRRLEDNDTYIEDSFSETYTDKQIGEMKVTVHVFKARAGERSAKETKETIRNEFFKNRMAVMFSVNGQVHGHYTTEFISRSLGYTLLKDYLLIHVDCTDMKYDFRTELFMASRDRLKQGDEAAHLRKTLASNLKSGELKEIFKRRKDSISIDISEDDSLLKSFAADLPMNDELRNLLSKTFKLDAKDKSKSAQPKSKPKPGKVDQHEKPTFSPQRYPTFFKVAGNNNGSTPVVSIPLNGEKTITFETDVENQYFDRTDDPGDMEIAVMKYTPNDSTGGTEPGSVNDISEVLRIAKQSPRDGNIKVVMKPNADVEVGDEIEIKVDLKNPGNDFTQILRAKVVEPRKPTKAKSSQPDEEPLGLPKLIKVYESADEGKENIVTWDKLDESGVTISHEDVMHPEILADDILEKVYINMDSSVFRDYRSKLRSQEQHTVAERRYISAVYFHTLFLYTISKKRGYEISKTSEDGQYIDSIDLTEYLKDMFSSHYASFLLNFGMNELMESLS